MGSSFSTHHCHCWAGKKALLVRLLPLYYQTVLLQHLALELDGCLLSAATPHCSACSAELGSRMPVSQDTIMAVLISFASAASWATSRKLGSTVEGVQMLEPQLTYLLKLNLIFLHFWAQCFSTQKRVNRDKIDFATKQQKCQKILHMTNFSPQAPPLVRVTNIRYGYEYI